MRLLDRFSRYDGGKAMAPAMLKAGIDGRRRGGRGRYLRLLAAAVLTASLASGPVVGQMATAPSMPEAILWKQELLPIPYTWTQGDRSQVREVVLQVSRDRGASWQEVTRAKPEVRFFTYRAAGDGEYLFAVQTIDQIGKIWPEGPPAPELRVVVDTRPPRLTAFQGALDGDGMLHVVWRATDEHLDDTSFKLEAQTDPASDWQPLNAGSPVTVGGNALSGQTTWQAPPGVSRLALRATIYDRAGNRATAGCEAVPSEGLPLLEETAPKMISALGQGQASFATSGGQTTPIRSPFGATSASSTASTSQPAFAPIPILPPVESISGSGAHSTPLPSGPLVTENPWQSVSVPLATAPASGATEQFWRANEVATVPFGHSLADQATRLPQPQATSDDGASPHADRGQSPFTAVSTAQPLGDNSKEPTGGQSQTALPASAVRVANTPTFALDYDLNDVGQWGIAKVELWGTTDEGRTWQSFAVDSDNRSPIHVTTPGEGTYGFKINVEAVGGFESQAPIPGERPEIWVQVDLSAPQTEIISAQQGEGYFADHLIVTWRAADARFAERPISLFYSSRPSGPWSTVATNLENTGRYSWRLQRHLPSQMYLRLEARDQAGNLGTHHTSSPISLNVPSGSGRIRDIRPLETSEGGARPIAR